MQVIVPKSFQIGSNCVTNCYNADVTTLRLHLLGEFSAITDDGVMGEFATDKVRALLAFLAAEADRPHTRTYLATLLWSEWDDASARANLRKSLFRLRKGLGKSADSILHITRSTVQFRAVSAEVDLLRFEQLAQSDDVFALATAVDLYGGELLAGMNLSGAAVFEEWLTVRREQCHRKVLVALQRLTEMYVAQTRYDDARQTATRQLTLEPWQEIAHRQLMRIAIATGQRAQALAQYEQCKAILDEELGAEPSAETQQLAAAIRQEQPSVARLHNFPPPLATFVGRDADIARLVARLHDPQTRLITLTGPGGVGKTRLSIEAVRHSVATAGVRDAYYVPLENVTTQNGVWQALGSCLNLQPDPHGLTTAEVLTFLRQHAPLLVLDNVEQLLPDTRCIEQILRDAPETRLLVTSRIPLSLRAEWRLPLTGLAVPQKIANDVSNYSAVALLTATAQQVQPDFVVNADNAAAIGRICRALAGMPLALEMAGSWLALFSPEQLTEQLESNLDFLVATRRDLPARHRSLRAIFDHAVEQLRQSERALLFRLAVFEAGFTLQAMLAVVAAPLDAVRMLVDHALLQRGSDDRYSLHPVLLAFVRETEHDSAEWRQKHAHYYLQHIAGNHSGTIGDTVTAIGRDTANINAAWRWAVASRDTTLLHAARDGLLAYYEFRGAYYEGRIQFAAAANALSPSALVNRLRLAEATCCQKLGEVERAISLVRGVIDTAIAETQLPALIVLGRLYERRGDYDDAEAILQEALALADPFSAEAAQIWIILGDVADYRGTIEERLATHQQALSISQVLGNELQSAECHVTIGNIYKDTGAYEQAFQHIMQALFIAEQLGHKANLARYKHCLGTLYWRQDNLEEAQQQYEQALAIATELNHQRTVMICTGALGIIEKRQRNYDIALTYYRQTLQLAEQLGDKPTQAVFLGNTGNALMDLGEYDRAIAHYEQAIEIDRASNALGGVGRHLGNIGDTLKFQKRYSDALPYFEQAIDYLRQNALSYFLCWVLIVYAECLIALGRLAEARAANTEGGKIATEIGRTYYANLSALLDVRLATSVDPDHARLQLLQLRAKCIEEDDQEMGANVTVELLELTGDNVYLGQAIEQFTQLYAITNRHQYKIRLDELRAVRHENTI